jgi:uncharacterized protein (DUF39 family)
MPDLARWIFTWGAAQPSEQADQAYGGGHVIADLVAGKRVHLRAIGQVTDCYPRADYETTLTRDQLNQFYLFNPRNAYQNFIVGVNGGDRPLYTYLGLLEPHLGNAVYSNPGELSPLVERSPFAPGRDRQPHLFGGAALATSPGRAPNTFRCKSDCPTKLPSARRPPWP